MISFDKLYSIISEALLPTHQLPKPKSDPSRNYHNEGYRSREFLMWRDFIHKKFEQMNVIIKDVHAARKQFEREHQEKDYNYVTAYRTHMSRQARNLHQAQSKIDKATQALEEVIQRDDAMESWRASPDYASYVKAKDTVEGMISELVNEN
jgi:hypothetical protein